jgi:mitogen-activated protein kinase 15
MFAGNSTLNQIEKLLSWTGPPTIQDLKSLSMNFNKSILDLLNTRRKVNKNDFFPTKIPPKCLDLINKTLEFDPEKRIKI